MTAERSLSLALELRSNGDRIVGRLEDQHGNDWPFTSRLGLLTLIERLGASAPSGDDPSGTRQSVNEEVS